MTTPAGRLLSLAEALALVQREADKLRDEVAASTGVEELPIRLALGRVLARSIVADAPIPSFDRSTRDGFAVRAAELSAGARLRVVGTIHAGQQVDDSLAPGECWQIMTGAPVLAGADAVVMVEHVERLAEGIRLAAGRTLAPGASIVPQGKEAAVGTVLIPAGRRIRVQEVALAASVGVAKLLVQERPTVAVFSTGDELVPLLAKPAAGQIYDSNLLALSAMASEAGAVAQEFPVVADERNALREAFRATESCDVLVLSGGVSAGEWDLVEETLAEFGVEILFSGVRIQPGRPAVFARRRQSGRLEERWQWIFALPGNPISAMVTFQLFARPLIAALVGEEALPLLFSCAPLRHQWKGAAGLTRFLPANFTSQGVELIPWQGSGDLCAFARANCCVVLPETASEVAAGTLVQIWRWDS